MVKLRDRKDDVFKADKLMNEQKGLKCKLMDCDKDITVMTAQAVTCYADTIN